MATPVAYAGNFVRSEDQVYYDVRYSYDTASQYWSRYDATGAPQDHYTLTDIGCQSSDGAQITDYSKCRRESRVSSLSLEYGASYYTTLYANTGYGVSQYVPLSPGVARTTTTAPLHSNPDTEPQQGMTDSVIGIRGRQDPYENYKTYEIEATVPTSRSSPGQSHLGCGVWGGAVRFERKDELGSRPVDQENGQPYLSLESGVGVYYWARPLNPQGRVQLAFSGNVSADWGWYLGAAGLTPLVRTDSNTNGAVNDCGTLASTVSGTFEIKHQFAENTTFSCGGTGALWGQDATHSIGGFCGLNYLWK